MRVRLHWAERFINFYPSNTKLYVRGARGADHAKARKLEKELFDSLVPFLDKLKREARIELANELKRDLPHIIKNTPHSCQTEEHCCALHAAHRAAAEKVEERLEAVSVIGETDGR
jgi:hypothetical protein